MNVIAGAAAHPGGAIAPHQAVSPEAAEKDVVAEPAIQRGIAAIAEQVVVAGDTAYQAVLGVVVAADIRGAVEPRRFMAKKHHEMPGSNI
jgi:hypothetical protein